MSDTDLAAEQPAQRMTEAEFSDIQSRLGRRFPLGLPFDHPVILDVLNLTAEVCFLRADLQALAERDRLLDACDTARTVSNIPGHRPMYWIVKALDQYSSADIAAARARLTGATNG